MIFKLGCFSWLFKERALENKQASLGFLLNLKNKRKKRQKTEFLQKA